VSAILLPPNQPSRFYRGGAAIARFRGLPSVDDHVPEDWVGSTTSLLGDDAQGRTVLPDGRLLVDAIAAAPAAFLGGDHVRSFGPDPAMLVKLLDAGERLPVHAHPDREFARQTLGARFGKSEAWLILAADGDDASLHLGFRKDVGLDALTDWVVRQDVPAMLAALNEISVEPGDSVYVPAGTPHAIGEGVLMVEVQEPSDLGVMLEWSSFGLRPDDATMGLGFDVALECVRRTAVGPDELASWRRSSATAPEMRAGARSAIPAAAETFFRAEWLRPDPVVELEPAFSILVAVDGAGRLETEAGSLDLAAGETVLVAHAAGAGGLSGDIAAIRCLPPLPEGASR
jgi:mannose-6-phosphate isomerase